MEREGCLPSNLVSMMWTRRTWRADPLSPMEARSMEARSMEAEMGRLILRQVPGLRSPAPPVIQDVVATQEVL